MVAVAFAVATSGAAPSVALIAGGLLTQYVDQQVIYPELFGKDGGPKPTALEGLQLSTTDPGAPRWEVFGSRAWVPCQYMWTRGIRESVSGNGQTGKGGRPFVDILRADVGMAVCDGPVNKIDALYSNKRPFWAREFNRALLQDSEWIITAGAGASAGRLVIEAGDAASTDFAGIFRVGNFAMLEAVLPATLLGPYRVAAVMPHTGTAPSRIELMPLRGQTPAAGTAGSSLDPARLRRIDQGCASDDWVGSPASLASRIIARPGSHPVTIPGPPDVPEYRVRDVWPPGAVYRFEGMIPASMDGLYGLIRLRTLSQGPITGYYDLQWTALEGQPSWTVGGFAFGTPTAPAIIIRWSSGEFTYFDSQQGSVQYLGIESQLQDATLSAHEADPPAHRGIAHLSMSNWNLAPHSNMFPFGVTASVTPRLGESVAAAITRICARALPAGTFDTSALPAQQLLGYSVPGGLTRGQALQPILTYHGIAVQDRGGVLTFLDERDLPVVAVATRHLNARPLGEDTQALGFRAQRVDEIDIPERVLLRFVDVTNDGNQGSEGDGVRAPGSPDRGGRDTIDIDLKPLVLWPHEAKRRARELRRRIRCETHRGQVNLPPGYMDVLPAHCLTYTSNNVETESIPPGTTIHFTTDLRDLVPGSIAIEVRFATSGRARLVDNGGGVFEGFPAGVTASPNSVDYATGLVQITCSESLDAEDSPTIRYRYARQWLMRANKATLRGHDFSVVCDVVSTMRDGPLPSLPRDIPTGLGGALVAVVPPYLVEVLDIPSIYPGTVRTVQIGFAAAPVPGASWRGATVFQSPNGTDRWVAVGTVQFQSPVGAVVGDGLPAGANPGAIDWETELVVDLPLGETLTSATLEQVASGQNLALCGDEVIGFMEVEPGTGGQWTLRGIVRGLRQTLPAMDSHPGDGERFVMLFGLGWMHGLLHEPAGGFAAANRTYYWRVVPGGAAITDVATSTTFVRGNSARPAPPIFEPDDVDASDAGLAIRWWRRSIDETTLFGPSPMPANDAELYHLLAFDHDQYSTLVGSMAEDDAIAAAARRRWVVGGEGGGTAFADRRVAYPLADITTDLAVAGGTTIGLCVRQVGAAGHSERSEIQTYTP